MDWINTEAGGAAAPATTAASAIPGEVGTPFLDGHDRIATALEGLAGEELSSAVGQTREDSLSELLELRDSPIYEKMEDVGGSLFPDVFSWNITDSLAGGVTGACDSARDDSLWKRVELSDSAIGLEMENLDGTLPADGSAALKDTDLVGLAGGGVAADVDANLESSSVNGLEIGGSSVDVKMEEVSIITPSGVESGASLITKPVAIDKGDEPVSHDDDNSGETESGDSESDDSSSEDTESSSSSSSEEEEELDEVGKGGGEESLEMVLGLSEEEEGEIVKGPIRSKNELENLPPVPPVDVLLEPHHRTMQVGLISSILGNKVIVEGSANHSPLNEGSVLWIADTRSPLGLIDEIFGPVKCPYYVIRFNSDQDIPPGIKEGTSVSFVSEFACHILEKDISMKGYDLSGDNDEELNDEVEFSDDEKEAEYRKSLRQAKRGTDDKKHWNRESGTDKKNNIKARGFEKGMNQPIFGGVGKSMGYSSAAKASYGTPLGAADTHLSTSLIPTDDKKHWNWETGTDKKNNNIKARGFEKGMNQPISGGVGKSMGYSSAAKASYDTPSGAANTHVSTSSIPTAPTHLALGGEFANPPRQFLNQLTALPNNGWPGMQQPFVPPQFGMPIPLLQQPYNVLPFGLPFQQLPNAAVTGFQMNGLPNQQLGFEAFHHQLHNHNASNIQNMMSYAQQLHPSSSMASIGNNFSTSFMAPGQANMRSQLGNYNLSNEHTPASSQGQMRPNMQFNTGNSSGQRRNPTKYGGRHKSRGGAQNRS